MRQRLIDPPVAHGSEECVLVGEALVEDTDGAPTELRHIAYARAVKTALGEQLCTGSEESIELLAAAALSRKREEVAPGHAGSPI